MRSGISEPRPNPNPNPNQVLDNIVRRFEATGYPDVTGLQGALVAEGNVAAAAYPGLDYIVRVEEEQ